MFKEYCKYLTLFPKNVSSHVLLDNKKGIHNHLKHIENY